MDTREIEAGQLWFWKSNSQVVEVREVSESGDRIVYASLLYGDPIVSSMDATDFRERACFAGRSAGASGRRSSQGVRESAPRSAAEHLEAAAVALALIGHAGRMATKVRHLEEAADKADADRAANRHQDLRIDDWGVQPRAPDADAERASEQLRSELRVESEWPLCPACARAWGGAARARNEQLVRSPNERGGYCHGGMFSHRATCSLIPNAPQYTRTWYLFKSAAPEGQSVHKIVFTPGSNTLCPDCGHAATLHGTEGCFATSCRCERVPGSEMPPRATAQPVPQWPLCRDCAELWARVGATAGKKLQRADCADEAQCCGSGISQVCAKTSTRHVSEWYRWAPA